MKKKYLGSLHTECNSQFIIVVLTAGYSHFLPVGSLLYYTKEKGETQLFSRSLSLSLSPFLFREREISWILWLRRYRREKEEENLRPKDLS